MSSTVKPKKTEYKKVIFDSKSEAVFARALDLAGCEWIYHPSPHCGHEWDFLAFPMLVEKTRLHATVGGKHYMTHGEIYRPRSKPMLIEYKPSMPTNTYLDNLTQQMRENPFESVVVWGNPWDGVRDDLEGFGDCSYTVYPIFSSLARYGWGDFIRLAENGDDLPTSHSHDTYDLLGISEEIAQKATEFRFDLA